MRRPLRLVVLGLVVIVAALVARPWLVRQAEPERALVPADSTTVAVRAVTLWFASPDGDSLAAESRELPEPGELHDRLAALVAALAAGPEQGGTPTLPAGTTLLHAYLDDAGDRKSTRLNSSHLGISYAVFC